VQFLIPIDALDSLSNRQPASCRL